MIEVKVSDLIAEKLEQLDIRHAFGIIGAGNVHLFEAVSRRGFTEIVCVHHEQAATMAMQTYYRSCGRMAAALLTTGGGATNGVTGVVSAWMDSMPGLVIAGNENSKFTKVDNPLRIWGVQGYDTVDMVRKVTKYASRVVDPQLAIFELEKAASIALDERPGPVWVEIPMNVQASRIDASAIPHFTPPVVDKRWSATAEEADIASVVGSLKSSRRPILWLGQGIRLAGAVDELHGLIEMLDIPALVTWNGIDMIESTHPRVIGRAGVYGQRAGNFALQNSDYVLAIGTRLAIPQIGYELSELARGASIDVVDVDVLEGRKLGDRVHRFIHADAGEFIRALKRAVPDGIGSKAEWLDQC
ncbi:MAG: acetolactate synthase isozyme 1 large subunit-like, partial [Rhizobacter sp.]|nr:acetolactate synthase isozyme 1 large subunit-like [Rhizobacter sp.]